MMLELPPAAFDIYRKIQEVDMVKIDARKLSINLGCIKKIPPGPDLAFIGCKSG